VETAPPEAEPEPAPEPEPADVGFGDGTYQVGSDVVPGTYRSEEATLCYWARLSGFGGELEDILANGNQGPEIVTIAEGDAGFETQGCGTWRPLEDTLPGEPATNFDDGTVQVGTHIAPGTYRADGTADELCYWARLSGFSAELDDVIANGNSPTVVEIDESDAGFTSFGCGSWSQ